MPNEKAGSADQSARKPKTVSKEQEQNVSKPKVTSADASAKASAQKAAAVSSKKPKKARGLRFERDFGFGEQGAATNQKRVETPSLNEMRAKQGAIVAKFMTLLIMGSNGQFQKQPKNVT